MKKLLLLIFPFICLPFLSPGQGNNCPAFAICNGSAFSDTPSGVGVQELGGANQGCLSVEHQSVWLSVTINTSGTFAFTINPNTNSDDFDFAVWGPGSTCPPATAPLRCSWAVKNNNFAGTADNGNTGISSLINSTHPLAAENDNSEGAGGNGWVNDISATAGQVYLVLVDNFSTNSGFVLSWSGTSTFSCTSLPIQLVYFKGNKEMTNRNLLQWETSSEENNNYFTVERSNNGFDFNTSVGNIPGAGNSNFALQYRLYDENPVPGLNYYRLKQTDYNTNYTYSSIILIDNSFISKKIIRVYNPLGQEVDKNAHGLKFILYSDGSVLKKMN